MGDKHSSDLEQRLALLAREVEFPPTPDLAPVVARRLQDASARRPTHPAQRRIVPARRALAIAIAGLLVAAAAAFAASPQLRETVLGAFGIDGVSVERRPDLPPVPPGSGPNLGERVALGEARRRAGFDLFEIRRPSFSDPDATYTRDVQGTPIVSFAYGPRSELPPSPHTETGLLLTQFRAQLERPLVGKVLAETGVARVRIEGRPGYWLEGAKHVIAYRTERGSFEQSPRFAGNTLVWQRGSITLRLEGEISKARALRIARSIR